MGWLRGARSAFPAGLVGMLVLLVAAESRLARRELDFVNAWGYDWLITGRSAAGPALKGEILCFGDSLIKFGVVPRMLEEQLGRPAYNLGLTAGTPVGSYYLLRRVLQRGARPRAVVLGVAPHTLTGIGLPLPGNQLLPELLELGETVDLAWGQRDCGLLGWMLACQSLPSARFRYELRPWALASLKGEAPDLRGRRWLLRGNHRNWTINEGANLAPPNPRFLGDPNFEARSLTPDVWSRRRGCEQFVERFLNLAASHGIPVFWLIAPFSPEIEEIRGRKGLDAEYTAYVRSLQVRYPGLVVVDARGAGYGREVHIDPIHLDYRGALALTKSLAAVLGRELDQASPADRWVAMPRYEEPGTVPHVEDIEKSQQAILSARQSSSRRR